MVAIRPPDPHRAAALEALLHPAIAKAALPIFTLGQYPAAIFAAFKVVEEEIGVGAVPSSGGDGTSLARHAFEPETGPLRDADATEREQEAMRDLFAGALAVFREGGDHRRRPVTDPTEAAELLVLASHLLRVVRARAGMRRRRPQPDHLALAKEKKRANAEEAAGLAAYKQLLGNRRPRKPKSAAQATPNPFKKHW